VVRSFIKAWREAFPEDEISVAVPRGDVDAARDVLGPDVRLLPTRLRPQGLSCAVELPFLARRHGPFDCTLTQNYTPIAMSGSRVTFIHDVLFQSNPEWFTPVERAYFSWMPRLATRADLVLTSSQHEAERIRRHNRGLDRVAPIGLGLSSDLVEVEPEPVAGLGAFVLSVGRLNVRKNLTAAIEGTLASGALTPELPLVVVGEREGRTAEHSAAVTAAVDDGRLRFLGGVSDAQLAWLYSRARLFVYVSLDEGFGLPPLEALHFGCPVVASDLPVFRETLGASAILVPPHDRPSIASAVAAVLAAPPPTPSPRDRSWDEVVRGARSHIAALRPGPGPGAAV